MAEVIIIEVDCDPALYSKVNGILGLDPNTGAGDWPKGLLTHIGGGGEGTVVVVEVWESRADQESWMATARSRTWAGRSGSAEAHGVAESARQHQPLEANPVSNESGGSDSGRSADQQRASM